MLAASPASSREREIVDRGRFLGQVWMAAAPGCLVTAPGGCLAMEGFLPPLGTERQSLSRLLAARKPGGQPWTPPPEGHYVLACFDEADRSLCLLRGLSGGERLYYARLGELILFASTVRALLAHPDVGRELNPARSAEAVLTGLTLFGADTLFDNVHEVLAGHALHARAGRLEQVWQWPGLLEPREGGRRRLARDYRDALADSITLAAGDARPVAVSLSGGIDSAAVAALAVEAFGADNVAAFTYEFDDPAHANETPFAVEVCRRLGIRRHDVLPIGLDEFLATIPETVWRAEHFVHWPKAFMLIAARRIREQGCRIVLSGFGIGSHMGFLEDLAWMIEQLPTPGAARVLPWLWRAAKTRRGRWLERAEAVHPAFASTNLRLHYLLTRLLGSRGLAAPPSRYYPREMRGLVEAAFDRRGEPDPGLANAPLADLLKQHAFSHLVSCVDVTRWEKPLRELGVHRVSPAHFARCLPYAYLPYRPGPRLWTSARTLRPGKHLLRLAMADRLPNSVLYRKKSWADAVVSPTWMRAGVRWMGRALAHGHTLPGLDPDQCRDALRYWTPRSPQSTETALAFWRRIFVDLPMHDRPPTWIELTDRQRLAA